MLDCLENKQLKAAMDIFAALSNAKRVLFQFFFIYFNVSQTPLLQLVFANLL